MGQPIAAGPVWGVATEDLNATILEWPARMGTAEHVNAERDVVLAVLAGSAEVEIDGEQRQVAAGEVMVIEKGSSRRISAGSQGVRYLTVHRKRAGLTVAKAPSRTTAD